MSYKIHSYAIDSYMIDSYTINVVSKEYRRFSRRVPLSYIYIYKLTLTPTLYDCHKPQVTYRKENRTHRQASGAIAPSFTPMYLLLKT